MGIPFAGWIEFQQHGELDVDGGVIRGFQPLKNASHPLDEGRAAQQTVQRDDQLLRVELERPADEVFHQTVPIALGNPAQMLFVGAQHFGDLDGAEGVGL